MVILESQGKPSKNPAKRDKMLQFMKSNKMFTAVVTVSALLLMVLCYGLAVRNVVAVSLGVAMLAGAIAYSFTAYYKEVMRLRKR